MSLIDDDFVQVAILTLEQEGQDELVRGVSYAIGYLDKASDYSEDTLAKLFARIEQQSSLPDLVIKEVRAIISSLPAKKRCPN